MKNEFYIGYMPKAPKGLARFAKIFVIVLFIIMGGTSYFLASSHNHITNGTYEFGELTELTGVIRMGPVPHIRIIADADGKIGKNIMLIDFGKFGAKTSVEKMQEQIGSNISEFEVTIRGTLIYQDGFTLLELTEKEKALQSYEKLEQASRYQLFPTAMVTKSLIGEIVDPKCYFGSMKPAQSKPHRSCASLCISGGIPPVYVVQTPQKTAEYYIIKGLEGEDLNDQILDFVADPTRIEGMVTELGEWKVLYMDPEKIRRLE